MQLNQDGVSVAIEKLKGDEFFLTLKAVGEITHEDYTYIIPMIDGAVKGIKHPQIKALINLTQFDGWADFEAMLDDFKFGMEHRHDFQKIALIFKDGSREKEIFELVQKFVLWFMDGEIKEFDSLHNALEWLRED
jgi:hypothetical protein